MDVSWEECSMVMDAALFQMTQGQQGVALVAPSAQVLVAKRRAYHQLYDMMGMGEYFNRVFGPRGRIGRRLPWEERGMRFIPRLEGTTSELLLEVCSKLEIRVVIDDGGETTVDVDPQIIGCRQRGADYTYAVPILDSLEADQRFRGWSVNKIDRRGIEGIGWDEWLLATLAQALTSDLLLDQTGLTLCSGSRSSNGMVPCVRSAFTQVGDVREHRIIVHMVDPMYTNPLASTRRILQICS